MTDKEAEFEIACAAYKAAVAFYKRNRSEPRRAALAEATIRHAAAAKAMRDEQAAIQRASRIRERLASVNKPLTTHRDDNWLLAGTRESKPARQQNRKAAQSAYFDAQVELAQLLEKLDTLRHTLNDARNTAHWGDVGSLKHLNQNLREALAPYNVD